MSRWTVTCDDLCFALKPGQSVNRNYATAGNIVSFASAVLRQCLKMPFGYQEQVIRVKQEQVIRVKQSGLFAALVCTTRVRQAGLFVILVCTERVKQAGLFTALVCTTRVK